MIKTNYKKEVVGIKHCIFDKNGFCNALCCYSDQICGARDENGNPKYSSR